MSNEHCKIYHDSSSSSNRQACHKYFRARVCFCKDAECFRAWSSLSARHLFLGEWFSAHIKFYSKLLKRIQKFLRSGMVSFAQASKCFRELFFTRNSTHLHRNILYHRHIMYWRVFPTTEKGFRIFPHMAKHTNARVETNEQIGWNV
jgi:hypothetical protein